MSKIYILICMYIYDLWHAINADKKLAKLNKAKPREKKAQRKNKQVNQSVLEAGGDCQSTKLNT